MAIDFKELGIELNEEQQKAATEAYEAAVEAEKQGLINKNAELLGKLKEGQQKLANTLTEKEAAELEAMKKAGDIKAIEERLTQQNAAQLEELQKKLADKDNQILGGSKASVKAELLGLAKDDGARELLGALLDSKLSAAYAEDGSILTTLNDLTGKAAGTTLESMREHIRSTPAFAGLIKANVGTGGNASNPGGQSKAETTKGLGAARRAENQAIKDKYNLSS